jgi:hypothetical protein
MSDTLQPGETTEGVFTMSYQSPAGGRYNGKLTITSTRLMYDAMFDSQAEWGATNAPAYTWDGTQNLQIPREGISSIKVVTATTTRTFTVTLADGSNHAFEGEMQDVDQAVAAIDANTEIVGKATPLSPAGKVLAIVFRTLGFLILFDIIGVIASVVFDILPLRSISEPLFYVVWCVLGALLAFYCYNSAGMAISLKDEQWTEHESGRKAGLMVASIMIVIVGALIPLLNFLMWGHGVEADHYVPDSRPLSLTFFITIIVATIAAHIMAKPSQSKETQPT